MSSTAPGAGDPLYAGPDGGHVAWGLAAFAGITLAIVGIMQVLAGIAAVSDAGVYAENDTYTYAVDLTTWGWGHLVVGALATLIGLGIIAKQAWAQAAGVGVAALASCVNFLFIPYFPAWAMILLAFNILVIWSLTRQLQSGRARR